MDAQGPLPADVGLFCETRRAAGPSYDEANNFGAGQHRL